MKKFVLIIVFMMTATLLAAGNYSRANDIVTDNDTGLQWQDTPYSDADKNAYNSETTESNRARQWIHAEAYCDSLNLDGGEWRLPAITELDAIVDKSQFDPALDPTFQNALGLGTWSGTKYSTTQAWGMGFESGNRHHCTINNKSKLIMCVREGSSTPPANQAPVAKAGPDQTVIEGDTVTLDGSSSTDPDGTITAYAWKEGSTTLSNNVSFNKSNFSVGTHTITLTVTDDDGATDSDTVVVRVNAAGNNPPIAKAGPDQSVIEGDTVTLDGSGSSDSDGTITAYAWKEGSTTLSNNVSFNKSDFSVGTHTITMTVTDDDGATDSDSVVVTVNSPANNLPVANAGPDQTVIEGDTVTLSGLGSSDSDGSITAYSWKEGSSVLSNAVSFDKSNFSIGTHTITLTVTDNDGATDSDSVVVTVNSPANNLPVANAGPDQTVIEGDTVTLSGLGSSDSDGSITAYSWKEGSSVLSNAVSFDKSNFSIGKHTITLTVTDNDGATADDNVVVSVQAISSPVPDWCNIEVNGETTKYTAKESESAVELPSTEFEIKEKNDDMIVFEEKNSSNVGNCQVKMYVKMENVGNIEAGYTHEGSGCSDDFNTFAPGTTATVGSDDVLRINAPLTDDLTLGGK